MSQTTTSPRVAAQQRSSHGHHPQQRSTTSTTPATAPSMTPFLSSRAVGTPKQHHPKPPSPGNYFAFQVDSDSFLDESLPHAKQNWSPPSSTVRSTAAISPSVVPLDQSPEYSAFRKQSEHGRQFSLGGGLNNFNNARSSPSASNSRPVHSRTTSHKSSITSRAPASPKDIPHNHRSVFDPPQSELSRSPKRVLSPGSKTESKRRGSPPFFDRLDSDLVTTPLSIKSSDHLPPSRPALPLDNMTASYNATKARAETLPATSESDAHIMVAPQHVLSLLQSKPDQILLLDLRVQTHYAISHISTALSLCIPTTLLKRPSFNVQKLADTFQDEDQKSKFENWRRSSHIIVYDSSSSLLKDATICLNTIKKFRGEGYEGTLYIIRGGFQGFSQTFPSWVESSLEAIPSRDGVDGDGPKIAPVIGGCPMPLTENPANPFFGNIRQNMDLIGGVGQIAIQHPSQETRSVEDDYPDWLKQAAEKKDEGKKVSNRFEAIERREKKRMEDALSGKVSWGTPGAQESGNSVRIAGLEKGNKNRYNNIWPFEHSRVRLQGVPSHGCDYFNANHIKTPWSNKRYISTQAPIPATFNDFWNVIWQQDVRVIVMLTAEKEGAQVKAHNYWDEQQYGSIHLEFLSEKRASLEPARIHKHQKRPAPVKRHSTKSSLPKIPLAPMDSKEDKDQPYAVVRKFTIRHDRFPFAPMREVTQLHYSGWPDFGAPAHPTHLVGLVEQCNAVVRATSKSDSTDPEPPTKRPILVHCSAGCGRTGTFCTVDSVIDMLKRQRISRGSRQGTPMDIDGTPPRNSDDQDGGFFASRSRGSSQDDIDGPWLQRDDQDLVEKTVEDFRHQRISMVQTLRQFVLCYESVMEWLVEHREGVAKEKR